MVPQALQRFYENKTGLLYIPPGCPWDNGYIESFTLFEARVIIGDFKTEHNRRHRHSALGYRTPAEYRCTHTPVACSIN
ncbi:hypothetical protein [Mycobacterium montefiorense]